MLKDLSHTFFTWLIHLWGLPASPPVWCAGHRTAGVSMENCPGCVTAATEARFFCRQCGTPVQAQAPTTSAPAPQHAPPPPATAPTLAFAPVFPVAPAAPVDAPAPVAAPPQLAAPTLAAP